jgi:hypothetical protein
MINRSFDLNAANHEHLSHCWCVMEKFQNRPRDAISKSGHPLPFSSPNPQHPTAASSPPSPGRQLLAADRLRWYPSRLPPRDHRQTEYSSGSSSRVRRSNPERFHCVFCPPESDRGPKSRVHWQRSFSEPTSHRRRANDPIYDAPEGGDSPCDLQRLANREVEGGSDHKSWRSVQEKSVR